MDGDTKTLIDKLSAFWKRLPGWLRLVVLCGLMAAGLEVAVAVIDRAADHPLPTLLVFAAVMSVGLVTGFVLDARRVDPAEVVAEAAISATPEGQRRDRTVAIVVAALAVLSVLVMAGMVALLPLKDGITPAGALGFGMGLLLIGLLIPVLSIGAITILGLALPAVGIRYSYRMVLAEPRRDALRGRADLGRFSGLILGFRPAVLRQPGNPAVYDLAPENLLFRLCGTHMTVAIHLDDDGDRMIVESVTRHGNTERNEYRAVKDAEQRVTAVEVEGVAALRSTVMRSFAFLLGVPHLAKGGAEVEARRLAQTTGTTVTVEDVTAERNDPSGIAVAGLT